MIPSQAAELFRPSLLPHERILWTGQPKQGLTLSARDTLLIPFSLFFAGFVILWNFLAWTIPAEGSDQMGSLFPLFGLPFLAAGLYVLFGRFFHDASIRKGLRYAVTDQRVLISRKSTFSSKVTSLDLHRLPRLELTEFRDGTGTLTFEPDNFSLFAAGAGFSWWLPSAGNTVQFFKIAEPRVVYDLIRKQSAV